MNRQWMKERRFTALLVILLSLLAGPPILTGFGLSGLLFDGLMSLVLLAAIASLCFDRRQRLFALSLGAPSIIFPLSSYFSTAQIGAWTLSFGHACEILFLFGSAMLIVKSLFSKEKLTSDSIFGAVCGYLFLGLGWAVLYVLIERMRAGSFLMNGVLIERATPDRMPADALTYFSFITLTTLGYGDVVPATAATRTCAWLEAITGQFYLAVVVAGLVALLTSRLAPSPRPDGDFRSR